MANIDEGGAEARSTQPPAPPSQSILTSKGPQGRARREHARASAAARRQAVDDGDAAIAVIVPRDFSAALYGATGRRAPRSSSTRTRPGLGIAITDGSRRAGAARLQRRPRGRAAGAVARARAASDPPPPQAAAAAASVHPCRRHPGRPADRATRAAVGGRRQDVSVTGLILAGMMVFFMFFGAANVARTILTEDRDGTLPRLFTTPTATGTILGGKFTSVFLTVRSQAIVLLIAGRLIFGIDWGRIDAVVRAHRGRRRRGQRPRAAGHLVRATPAQAGAIGAGVYLVLALLGGNFTGTAHAGATYATIQKFTPNGWLLAGLGHAMHGGDVADIRWQVLVPLGFAVVFFSIAVLRFRRRYA